MTKNARTGYGLGLGGPIPNIPPSAVESTRNPNSLDTNFELQTTWINTNTRSVFIYAGDGVWKTVGGGGGTGILDITGDTGGAVGADGFNNINIVGDSTSGIATTGTPGTNTVAVSADASTTTQRGTTRYATKAEVGAQSISDAAITPNRIGDMFAINPVPVGQGGTGQQSYTDGQILIGNSTGNTLTKSSLTAGAGISITPGSGSITIAATGGGGNLNYTNMVYLATAGSDLNDGLSINKPVKTIGAALIVASTLIPAPTNRVVIYCPDDGIYTESFNMFAYTDLYAPNAEISGHITIQGDCYITLNKIDVPTGQIGIYKTITKDTAQVKINTVSVAGTGIGFFCDKGVLICDWEEMTITNGFGVGDASSLQEHTHLNGKDIYINGTGVGIARGNSGTTVGHVDHILNINTGLGTAITVNSGTIDISVGIINTTTAYNISSGVLNLSFDELSGTRVSTGGTVHIWNPKSYGIVSQVMQGRGNGVDADWATLTAGDEISIIPTAGTITISKSQVAELNVVYVGIHGNNANNGFSIDKAVATFSQAVTIVNAQTPGGFNKWTIWCEDDGIYTDNIALAAFVDLYAPIATLNGTITMDGNCHITLGNMGVATGTTGITKTAGTANSSAYVKSMICDGTGNGFLNAGNAQGQMICKWDTLGLVTGTGVGSLTAPVSHNYQIYGDVVQFTGAGTVLANNSAGAIMNAYLGYVFFKVGGAGCTLAALSNGVVYVHIARAAASNLYNVSGGDLSIFGNVLGGVRTTSGGTVEVWSPKPYGIAGQVMTSGGPGVDADWANVGSILPAQQQIFYVGKHGNDANNGRNIDTAVLTFGQAITLAIAALPSSTNRFVIWCFDEGSYVEDLAVPQYVDIYAPDAEIEGTINITDSTSIKLRSLISNPAGSTCGIIKTGSSNSYVDIDYINCTTGSGTSAIELNSGNLYAKWKQIYVDGFVTVESAILNAGTGELILDGQYINLTNVATALAWEDVGSIKGRIEVIEDITTHDTGLIFMDADAEGDLYLGTVTGVNSGISLNSPASTLRIVSNYINCFNNVYNTNGGSLAITCNALAGARIGNASLTVPFQWQIANLSSSMASQNGYIVTSGTPVFSLPLKSHVGDILEVTLSGGTSWNISYTTGQQIQVGIVSSTITTGSVSSSANGDSVRLVCVADNTKWIAVSHTGTLTVV